jgi:hypothetical protein
MRHTKAAQLIALRELYQMREHPRVAAWQARSMGLTRTHVLHMWSRLQQARKGSPHAAAAYGVVGLWFKHGSRSTGDLCQCHCGAAPVFT